MTVHDSSVERADLYACPNWVSVLWVTETGRLSSFHHETQFCSNKGNWSSNVHVGECFVHIWSMSGGLINGNLASDAFNIWCLSKVVEGLLAQAYLDVFGYWSILSK